MLRARIALIPALALGTALFATPSHASTNDDAYLIACSPLAADVCATYAFVCQRLAYHNIYLAACYLA